MWFKEFIGEEQMNLMQDVISNTESVIKNKHILERIESLKSTLKKNNVKITKTAVLLGDTYYYANGLPFISEARDVLRKPNMVCKVFVNWKNKSQITPSELKAQWGWTITTVDAEHQRNKYKNKSILWAVFDTEEKAKLCMNLFNKMFITAIEWDTIEEYKKFKKNPEKRPLTFDKIINKEDAYRLYDEVDQGKY